MSDKIRVILVGAGRMGRNHLRVVRENPNFELVAIVDKMNAGVKDIPQFASIDEVNVDYQAAIVATPTSTHHDVAMALIDKGKNLLVEKPLASTASDARKIHAAAQAKGIKLAVGHVERFNPAVRKLGEVIKAGFIGKPIHFSFTRVGGYPNTVLAGNNVVVDLAVHDIDVLRSLVGDVELVAGVNHSSWQPHVVDTSELLLKGASGLTAAIHVNWITPTKIRQIRVTGTKAVCFVDYIMQTCELFGGSLLDREPPEHADFDKLLELYKTSDKISFGVDKVEPLKVQLSQFADLVRTGSTGQLCLGEDAISAVEIAEKALAQEA